MRRRIRNELLLVLGVSLGQSAVYSIVDLLGKLSSGRVLAAQSSVLNPTHAPGRPWLDLSFQLVGILFGLVPAFLALHLLGRDGERHSDRLGLRPVRAGFDLRYGVGLAALIGIPGLGFYFASRAMGINTTVVPEALPMLWWTVPILVLSAAQNAILEEVVVVGYLMTRLRELAWGLPAMVLASSLLRGSYHLYQGFGGFIGNAVMGSVFALFYLRYKRIGPLVVAHTLLDTAAFVGYALLKDHVAFLN